MELSSTPSTLSSASSKSVRNVVIAGCISLLGLGLATVSLMYIAGMFGLATAFASQIVNAVEVGGWVLAVVMAAISGGIAGAVIATALWAITSMGKTAAVA